MQQIFFPAYIILGLGNKRLGETVLFCMTKVVRVGNWIATVGALIFVLMLFVSAYAEPDIRWLHFFQSWMYFATIILIWRKNKWGYFVGIGAAAFWDYVNVFVNTF